MRPVTFGEVLPAGTRLTLVSDDKPDCFFTVIKFWVDETPGVALALKGGVPSYQVEDEEGRTHLLIHLAWKPETASVSSARSNFRHLEPSTILRVFTILKEHRAADIPFSESLVATPTMRAHLGDVSKKMPRSHAEGSSPSSVHSANATSHTRLG